MTEERERLRRRADLATNELARLASNVAHDLRTPLAAIVGYLELLRIEVGETLDDRPAAFLRRAEEGAGQLVRMIDGVSLLARVDLDPPLEPVAWADVIAHAIGELPADLSDLVDAIAVGGALPTVAGSRTELSRAVRCLLDNALRHHPEPRGARVTVRASEGGALVIEDDGSGIPDRDLERSTQPFRASPPHGPHGGVGLAIASRIAQAHGGELSLGPSTLGGLRAALRIPLAEGDG